MISGIGGEGGLGAQGIVACRLQGTLDIQRMDVDVKVCR